MKKLFLLLGLVFLAACNSSDDDTPQPVDKGNFATDLAALKQIADNNAGKLNWDFSATNTTYTFDGVTWTGTGEEKRVTKLDVENKNLTTLVGVEKLYKLTYLDCGNNKLPALNVLLNINLRYLYCTLNKLPELDVSKNTQLIHLYCGGNNLLALDVSKNTKLTYLECAGNQIKILDVSKNTDLTSLICSYNKLTALDVSQHTKFTELYCNDNQLTELLGVSKNTKLTQLSCGNNKLTALDISNNTLLTRLDCNDNQFTALDVSNNTVLTGLFCQNNQLSQAVVDEIGKHSNYCENGAVIFTVTPQYKPGVLPLEDANLNKPGCTP